MQKKLGATPVASAQQPTTKSAVAQPNDVSEMKCSFFFAHKLSC